MFEASGFERYPQAVAMMSLCNGVGNTIGGLFGGRYVIYSVEGDPYVEQMYTMCILSHSNGIKLLHLLLLLLDGAVASL